MGSWAIFLAASTIQALSITSAGYETQYKHFTTDCHLQAFIFF